jgi:glutamate--cysteine ligase catalytic subunit
LERNSTLERTFHAVRQSKLISVVESRYFKGSIEEEYEECSIADIMNGNGTRDGICTLIDKYLDEQDIGDSTRQILKDHVNVVRQRATGERLTNATWIRNFIHRHPAYKKDSIVTPEINYDLINKILHLDSSEMLH